MLPDAGGVVCRQSARTVLPSVVYTYEETVKVLTMERTRESYPDQIRRIAEDLTQVQHLWELDYQVKKLRRISDEIESQLKEVKALNSE